MRLQKNLRLIDAYTVGMNMMFILPVILPYYRDQIGIGFKEFLIGEAVFAATVVLLDVPTGWISDMWQRKHTQALGIFFDFLGFACLLFADSFAMAVLAQGLIGVGISLCSGTNTAILYDSLLSAGKEDKYRKREGRRQALGFYTVAVSSMIGGLLYPVHHQLPVVMTLVALILAFIAVCFLDEPERHKRVPERHPVADIVATIKYALHGHAEVGFLILFSAVLFCSTKIIMWSQQPYYMLLKIPEAYYGVFMAGGFVMGGMSSHASHLLSRYIRSERLLAVLWAAALLVGLGAAIAPGWHGVILLMVGGTCIYGMASPCVNETINQSVDSSRRATVLSTQTLMTSLLFIPLSTVMGKVSAQWGIQAVLASLVLWLLLAGAFLGVIVLRRRKVKNHPAP